MSYLSDLKARLADAKKKEVTHKNEYERCQHKAFTYNRHPYRGETSPASYASEVCDLLRESGFRFSYNDESDFMSYLNAEYKKWREKTKYHYEECLRSSYEGQDLDKQIRAEKERIVIEAEGA